LTTRFTAKRVYFSSGVNIFIEKHTNVAVPLSSFWLAS